jgi:gamma-glutamyl:cysteine ligase YbdK (ATP-grasp superfamily)
VDWDPLHLFEGYGIELEYMIVDRESLAVKPISDRLIHAVAGSYESEIELGDIAWSNELVLHVIELKTNGPTDRLEGLAARFAENVHRIDSLLEGLGGRLLGSAMHPWMDPMSEMHLWPHEYNPVYETFHRIFDCRGHGWANLQSMHINLPFSGDAEFARLHAAVRLVLPILPALAASSPIVDGKPTGFLDTRLEVYKTNSAAIPSMTGSVIPEPVYTREAYELQILGRIYRDLAPHDPQGVLQHEFANARGAIARFDRNAIEIRVIDVQEHPSADIAIAAAAVAVLRHLMGQSSTPLESLSAFPLEPLASILDQTIRDADQAVITDAAYLEALTGATRSMSAGLLWRSLLDRAAEGGNAVPGELSSALDLILRRGPLARRILTRTGSNPTRASIADTYRELAACLEEDRLFE